MNESEFVTSTIGTIDILESSWKHVSIDYNRLNKVVHNLFISPEIRDPWANLGFEKYQEKLNFIFFFNAINFSFWGDPDWSIEVNGNTYTRTAGLTNTIYNEYLKDKNFLNVNFIDRMDYADFKRLFEGNGRLNNFYNRWLFLRQTFLVIKEIYHGEIVNLINDADRDAKKIAQEIENKFPNFIDRAIYRSRELKFSKRVIVVLMNLIAHDSNALGIHNYDNLIVAADYRIPQLLRYWGILKYEASLADTVDRQQQVAALSEEEVEIRMATIRACRVIVDTYNFLGKGNISAIALDSFLWSEAKKKGEAMLPHHRTYTWAY